MLSIVKYLEMNKKVERLSIDIHVKTMNRNTNIYEVNKHLQNCNIATGV